MHKCAAPLNKMAVRALDKTSSPKSLVQNQNNFMKMFLIMPSTKMHKLLNPLEHRGPREKFLLKNISYPEPQKPICLIEQNLLCNLGRRHLKGHLCEINLNLDQ